MANTLVHDKDKNLSKLLEYILLHQNSIPQFSCFCNQNGVWEITYMLKN